MDSIAVFLSLAIGFLLFLGDKLLYDFANVNEQFKQENSSRFCMTANHRNGFGVYGPQKEAGNTSRFFSAQAIPDPIVPGFRTLNDLTNVRRYRSLC